MLDVIRINLCRKTGELAQLDARVLHWWSLGRVDASSWRRQTKHDNSTLQNFGRHIPVKSSVCFSLNRASSDTFWFPLSNGSPVAESGVNAIFWIGKNQSHIGSHQFKKKTWNVTKTFRGRFCSWLACLIHVLTFSTIKNVNETPIHRWC